MKLFILGATGSIGQQTLEVVRNYPKEYEIISVTTNTNVDSMRDIIQEFSPKCVSVGKKEDALLLQKEFMDIDIVYGNSGLIKAVTYDSKTSDDMVVNALVGSVGLTPTIKAIEYERNIALANKETLVIGGELVTTLAKEKNVTITPIDSEHSALYQLLEGKQDSEIESLIITASGGSFRDKGRTELKTVTKADALAHPNWDMGAKITIDSATMMNKGFEIIEAHYLFGVPYDKIQTVLHKESIVHSMVELCDGSILAHLGHPDMRVPIQYALTAPLHKPFLAKRLRMDDIFELHFEPLSAKRYPLLQCAKEAGNKKGLHPTTLNAANEAAVQLFLEGTISFLEIETIVQDCLNKFDYNKEVTLESIMKRDQIVKDYVITQYN